MKKIDFDSTSGENDSERIIRNVVRDVLDQLVLHFRQNIHSSSSSSSFQTTTIPEPSSIVEYFLHKLWSIPSNDNAILVLRVILEWIQGYKIAIRSVLFDSTYHIGGSRSSTAIPRFNPSSVHVLKAYESILSRMIKKLIVCHNHDEITDDDINNNSSSSSSSNNRNYREKIIICSSSSISSLSMLSLLEERIIPQMINNLSTDITLLTADFWDRNDSRNNNEEIDEDENGGVNKSASSNYHCQENNNNNNNNNRYMHLRKNVALPTLLKILSNTFSAITQCFKLNNDNNTKSNSNNSLPEYYCTSLRRCVCTLFAFDNYNNNSNDIDNNDRNHSYDRNDNKSSTEGLLNVLYPHHLAPTLAIPLSIPLLNGSNADGIIHTPCNDDIDDNYWESYSDNYISKVGWIDHSVLPRLVDDVWSIMSSLLLSYRKIETGLTDGNDDDDDDNNHASMIRKRRHSVLQILGGASLVLPYIRSHFFGRDMDGVQDLLQKEQQQQHQPQNIVIRMGRLVADPAKRKNLNDDPPYQIIPSRIAVALNSFRSLLTSDMIFLETASYKAGTFHCTNRTDELKMIVEDIFPICASLVDSLNPAIVTLGAAGFTYSVVTITEQLLSNGINNSDDIDSWINFLENALSVLERAFQSNEDHGPVVVAIGRTQSKIFETMFRLEEEMKVAKERDEKCFNRFRLRRRTITGQWLARLERSSYRSINEKQSLELLWGGVIPLLKQHSIDPNIDFDAMEVGRLGLSALLPLIETTTMTDAVDDITKKTQIASMIALIYLMISAYPIMPSHGGKIMSRLLANTATSIVAMPGINCNENRRSDDSNSNIIVPMEAMSVRDMTVITAAVALLICGSKFAGKLIYSIEKDCDKYEPSLLTAVSEVRKLAEKINVIVPEKKPMKFSNTIT